ncbi:MAG: hypothetical protein K9J18_08330 [Crocinitomicaceae bacterium]|nr:hypothetical protein [Crocinitomicaceae bacterium]
MTTTKNIVTLATESAKTLATAVKAAGLVTTLEGKVEKTAILTTPKRSMVTSYFHLTKIAI